MDWKALSSLGKSLQKAGGQPLSDHTGLSLDAWDRPSIPAWHLRRVLAERLSDDKTKTGGQDRKRIDVNEDYELRVWSKKFNITLGRCDM